MNTEYVAKLVGAGWSTTSDLKGVWVGLVIIQIVLSFFGVFALQFRCPLRSSGLALNKGHEKRWHLSMARRLHGAIGHGAMCGGRRERLLDWGTWCFGHWAVG